MRIEQLYHFIEVCRYGSIAKASKFVYLSQSALSLSIKSLENDLENSLFDRTKKGFILTDFGKSIYNDAIKITKIVDKWNIYSDYKKNEIINIILTPIISHYITPSVIIPFQKENKSVQINIETRSHSDILKQASRRDLHMILCTIPMKQNYSHIVMQSGYREKHVFTDERQIFLADGNHYAHYDILTEDMLRNMTLAYYSNVNDLVSHYFIKFFKNSIRLANKEDILDLVVRSQAVFIHPSRLFRYDYRLADNSITSRPFRINGVSSDAVVQLFYRSGLGPACQRLKSAIVKEFSRLRDTV